MDRFEWKGDKIVDSNIDDAYAKTLTSLVWNTNDESDGVSKEINEIVEWAERKLRPEIERYAKK